MQDAAPVPVETDHQSLWTYVTCPTLVVDQTGAIRALSASAQSLLPEAGLGTQLETAVGWLSPVHLRLVEPASVQDSRESFSAAGPVAGRKFDAHHAMLPGGEVAWSLVEDTGQVLNASVFGGFPQADIPHLALSSVIVCDRRTAEGEVLLNKILDTAWEKREGFLFHPEPLSVQVARAKSLDGGPVVMADHGDNTASGGTQDVMSVVEEAMKQGLEDACAGPICDPGCVEQMIKAGVGGEVTLELGGKVDMPAMGLKGKPLKVTGKVKAITDGQFTVTGPMATGTTVRMGRTAVLDTGKMQIVVSEKRAEPFDLGVFTHCGIDPRRKKYVLIKSRQHFRAGFEPIAKHIVMCDGDGCTASDLKLFKYTRVKRPLYPFDLDMRLGRNEA